MGEGKGSEKENEGEEVDYREEKVDESGQAFIASCWVTGLKTLTGSKGWVMGQVLKSSLSRTVLETKNRVFMLQLNGKEVNVRTVGRLVGERRRCVWMANGTWADSTFLMPFGTPMVNCGGADWSGSWMSNLMARN